jgi:hypothetical protein
MEVFYNCSIGTATATNNAVYRLEDTDTWACMILVGKSEEK